MNPRAHQQLQDKLAFVAQDSPIAAAKIAERIYTAERLLASNPTLGRPGRIADTREWVVQGTPFLIGYSVEDHELVIVALLHSKQQWPMH